MAPDEALQGKLWFWKLSLQKLTVGRIEVAGRSLGQLSLTVTRDANLEGYAEIGLRDLAITSPDLSSPLALGDYTLQAGFATSAQQFTISRAQLTPRRDRRSPRCRPTSNGLTASIRGWGSILRVSGSRGMRF